VISIFLDVAPSHPPTLRFPLSPCLASTWPPPTRARSHMLCRAGFDADARTPAQVEMLKKERTVLSSRVQELFDENERLKKQMVSAV